MLFRSSATGSGPGAGSFTPGTGAQGAEKIYYYKLGFKPVDAEKLHKASKTLDHKDLWKKKLEEDASTDAYMNSLNLPDDSIKQFVQDRVSDFDKIEDKLNILLPLLKKAKAETMKYYKNNPDYNIQYGTDLAVDYLDDLITLFRDKKEQ